MFFPLVICISALYLLWKVLFQKTNNVNDPPEISRKLPILGHCHLLMGGSTGTFKGIKGFSEECLEKGGVTKIYLRPRSLYYGLTDPEDTLHVANVCLQKDYIYTFAKPFLGDGLVIGSVPTWKKHRKLLNPAFNQQVLNSFVDVFNKQARKLVDQYATETGKSFDHEHLLRLNNLETICITATGVGPDEYNEVQKEYLPCMENILIIMTQRFQKFWLHSEFLFNLSSLKKKQDEVVKTLLNLSSSIVKRRKKEMQTKMLDGTFEIEKSQGKPKPFMDLILELAHETNCFTDEEIREETDNIVAGGHDTSATHLTFAFAVLGSYPEVQQKVYDEIINVIGPEDRDLDKEDISKLVYIDAVLKETLRLYPIAPFIGRYIDKDIKLKKYTLKANSGCFFFVYGINRHPMWGLDANEFKPERWLDPSTLPDMNYFGGFGLGRRSCIGKVYAMMSMKTIMAHMIRRYRIRSDISQMVLGIDVMLRPESGHHISLELRE